MKRTIKLNAGSLLLCKKCGKQFCDCKMKPTKECLACKCDEHQDCVRFCKENDVICECKLCHRHKSNVLNQAKKSLDSMTTRAYIKKVNSITDSHLSSFAEQVAQDIEEIKAQAREGYVHKSELKKYCNKYHIEKQKVLDAISKLTLTGYKGNPEGYIDASLLKKELKMNVRSKEK